MCCMSIVACRACLHMSVSVSPFITAFILRFHIFDSPLKISRAADIIVRMSHGCSHYLFNRNSALELE